MFIQPKGFVMEHLGVMCAVIAALVAILFVYGIHSGDLAKWWQEIHTR